MQKDVINSFCEIREKRELLESFSGLQPESQRQNLALTFLCVPCSLGSESVEHFTNPRTCRVGARSRVAGSFVFRVSGSGFRVSGFGESRGLPGFGSRDSGFGFRVSRGLEFVIDGAAANS